MGWITQSLEAWVEEGQIHSELELDIVALGSWIFSTNGAGTTMYSHTKIIESRHRLYPFTKVKSQWIIDLNVKHKPIKRLDDNIGESLDNLGFGDDFLGTTAKA